jgi:DNA polymerase III sliding clamp (beta) subunit (PCNA family)
MITIEREPLLAALSAASRLASNKHWEELQIGAGGGFLRVAATDGEHWITLDVPCSGDMDAVCVHASRLNDVVAALPGDLIGFNVEGPYLKIHSGKGRRSLTLATATAIPEREFKASATVKVEAGALREALAFTAPSAADQSDPTKWQWAGVRFETRAGELRLFATDRHNLAVASLCASKEQIGATISPKLAETVVKLGYGEVEIGFSERAVQCRWPGGQIIGPLIDGPWIPLDALYGVLEGERSLSFGVESKELLAAVRSVRPIGFFDRGSRSTGIKLTLNGKATLSTQAPEGTTEQEFDADYDGEEYQTGFAAARMERVLNAFGDAVLTVAILDTNGKALRFEAAARPDRVALLYPMQI